MLVDKCFFNRIFILVSSRVPVEVVPSIFDIYIALSWFYSSRYVNLYNQPLVVMSPLDVELSSLQTIIGNLCETINVNGSIAPDIYIASGEDKKVNHR